MENGEMVELLEQRFVGANVYETEVEMSAWPLFEGSVNAVAYTRVTSSYEDGPEPDLSGEIRSFLEKFGYVQIKHTTTGCDERCYSNSETYYYTNN